MGGTHTPSFLGEEREEGESWWGTLAQTVLCLTKSTCMGLVTRSPTLASPGPGPLLGPSPCCSKSAPCPTSAVLPLSTVSLLHTTSRGMCQEGKSHHTSPHSPDNKIQFPSSNPQVHPNWSSMSPCLHSWLLSLTLHQAPPPQGLALAVPSCHQTTSFLQLSAGLGPSLLQLPVLVADVLDSGADILGPIAAGPMLTGPQGRLAC